MDKAGFSPMDKSVDFTRDRFHPSYLQSGHDGCDDFLKKIYFLFVFYNYSEFVNRCSN